jgi:RNA polymerase sigma factor (sigma-70 family)
MSIAVENLVAVLSATESVIRARYTRKLAIIAGRFDIEDLLQETARKCFGALESCNAQSDDELSHWVLQTARFTCQSAITTHRSLKRSTAREQVAIGVATDDSRDGYQPAVDADPSVACEIAEQTAAMLSALESIPANQAKAVRMSYLDGADYPEIAEALGVSVNACRLLVSRGIKAVRELVA